MSAINAKLDPATVKAAAEAAIAEAVAGIEADKASIGRRQVIIGRHFCLVRQACYSAKSQSAAFKKWRQKVYPGVGWQSHDDYERAGRVALSLGVEYVGETTTYGLTPYARGLKAEAGTDEAKAEVEKVRAQFEKAKAKATNRAKGRETWPTEKDSKSVVPKAKAGPKAKSDAEKAAAKMAQVVSDAETVGETIDTSGLTAEALLAAVGEVGRHVTKWQADFRISNPLAILGTMLGTVALIETHGIDAVRAAVASGLTAGINKADPAVLVPESVQAKLDATKAEKAKAAAEKAETEAADKAAADLAEAEAKAEKAKADRATFEADKAKRQADKAKAVRKGPKATTPKATVKPRS